MSSVVKHSRSLINLLNDFKEKQKIFGSQFLFEGKDLYESAGLLKYYISKQNTKEAREVLKEIKVAILSFEDDIARSSCATL